jgi:hypothetical protein
LLREVDVQDVKLFVKSRNTKRVKSESFFSVDLLAGREGDAGGANRGAGDSLSRVWN